MPIEAPHYQERAHRDPEHGFMTQCVCGTPTCRHRFYSDALTELADHFEKVGLKGRAWETSRTAEQIRATEGRVKPE